MLSREAMESRAVLGETNWRPFPSRLARGWPSPFRFSRTTARRPTARIERSLSRGPLPKRVAPGRKTCTLENRKRAAPTPLLAEGSPRTLFLGFCAGRIDAEIPDVRVDLFADHFNEGVFARF